MEEPELNSLLEALGQSQDPRAVRPLLRVLDENSGYTSHERARAIYALGALQDSRAVQPLLRALKHRDPEIRDAAALALGQIGAPALDVLHRALFSDRQEERVDAARALGRIGQPAWDMLLQTLQHYDPIVRGMAASGLGQSGTVRAILPLLQALDDAEPSVQQEAVAALRQLDIVRGLPQGVLSEPGLTAQERTAILEALWELRFRIQGFWLHIPVADLLLYCRQRTEDPDPAVRAGAEAVLEYCTLARPSQRGADEPDTLLRTGAGIGPEEPAQEFLRGSEDPQDPHPVKPQKPRWLRRLFPQG